MEKFTGKQLVDRSVYDLMGKIVAIFLSAYIVLKSIDTIYWAIQTVPGMGFRLSDFYQPPYGMWLLTTEIFICGFLPAILLWIPQCRKSNFLLFSSFFLVCVGIIINRFAMTVQVLALPVMTFDQFQVYIPTFYEWAPVIAMVAYCAFVISLAYRYTPLFPQDAELNPVKR
jgi:molybdopterin-containing oxidoreductase family membrane subunit